jgi:hypothetical protein
MEFPSNILQIFKEHAGTLAPLDGVLGVPKILTPVITIPESLNEMRTTGDAAATQRTSFFISRTVEQTNSVGASTNVCLIGPGLWEIELQSTFVTNYTDVAAGQRHSVFLNASPISNTVDLNSYYASNNSIISTRHFTLALPLSGGSAATFYALGISTATNVAGQTINISVSVLGNRLG